MGEMIVGHTENATNIITACIELSSASFRKFLNFATKIKNIACRKQKVIMKVKIAVIPALSVAE